MVLHGDPVSMDREASLDWNSAHESRDVKPADEKAKRVGVAE